MISSSIGRLILVSVAIATLYVALAVSAAALTGSPWPLISILPAIWITAVVLGVYWGLKHRGEVKRMVEAGDDPFVGSGFSTAQLWGFRSGSGTTVGGGLYTTLDLEVGEETIISLLGGYSRNQFIAGHGYLTLTNRRIIFTGSRLPVPLVYRKASIRYSEIDSCQTGRCLNLGMFIASLAPAIVVTAASGGSHYLWPAVANREKMAAQIRDLKRRADGG